MILVSEPCATCPINEGASVKRIFTLSVVASDIDFIPETVKVLLPGFVIESKLAFNIPSIAGFVLFVPPKSTSSFIDESPSKLNSLACIWFVLYSLFNKSKVPPYKFNMFVLLAALPNPLSCANAKVPFLILIVELVILALPLIFTVPLDVYVVPFLSVYLSLMLITDNCVPFAKLLPVIFELIVNVFESAACKLAVAILSVGDVRVPAVPYNEIESVPSVILVDVPIVISLFCALKVVVDSAPP